MLPDEFMQHPESHRAFEELVRPLGTELLARAAPEQLADRAKVISVLRRVDYLIRYRHPHIENEPSLQEAMDVAEHDVGVHAEEYRAMLRHDPELRELEQSFHEAVRAMFPITHATEV